MDLNQIWMDENQLIGPSFLGGSELEQELVFQRDVLIKPSLTNTVVHPAWGWENLTVLGG